MLTHSQWLIRACFGYIKWPFRRSSDITSSCSNYSQLKAQLEASGEICQHHTLCWNVWRLYLRRCSCSLSVHTAPPNQPGSLSGRCAAWRKTQEMRTGGDRETVPTDYGDMSRLAGLQLLLGYRELKVCCSNRDICSIKHRQLISHQLLIICRWEDRHGASSSSSCFALLPFL